MRKTKSIKNKLPDSRFWILDSRKGFTLIESLVAVGLFGVIISLAVGGFVKALRTESQITSLLSANGNASLSIEQVAREVRTGTDFACVHSRQSAPFCVDQSLSFVNSDGESVVYDLRTDSTGRGYIEKTTTNPDSSVTVLPLTAANVDVKYLVFYLEPGSPATQPSRVTVSMGVSPAGAGNDISVTKIQTTVSARQG